MKAPKDFAAYHLYKVNPVIGIVISTSGSRVLSKELEMHGGQGC
jgi:hypothetical protein